MEELDRRHKAIEYLFEPTFIKGTNTVYGMCGEYYPIERLNYFDYQYYLNKGQDKVISSYEKEEYKCKQFLDDKIGFTELIFSLENFFTLQAIILNLEFCRHEPKEVSNNGK